MSAVWEKFDEMVDVKGLAADVKEVGETGGTFKDVPHGEYAIKINKLELVQSKAGDPMVTCWMKVLAGEYKGSMIFMNQVITRPFQIHIANEFLRSLVDGLEIAVEFVSYSQYNQLLMDIAESIDEKFEYGLEYGEGKKGFSTFTITEIFELEN